MWNERGWIKLYQSWNANLVWWGEIGQDGVCLYDWDTTDKLWALPGLETMSRLTLYANPRPPVFNIDVVSAVKPWSLCALADWAK